MEGPPVADRAPWTRPAWVTGGLVVVAVVAAVAWSAGRWAAQPEPAPTPMASPSAEPTPLTAAEVATLLAPSLVAISVTDAPSPADEPQGTGVVVSDDATVLTALHVVAGAGTIRVSFADGTTTSAVVAGADPENDIATLVPERLPTLIVPAVLGTSQPLAVGSDVVALGNPLGLTASVSTGVVSGLDRIGTAGGTRLSGLIQFDAAVNPGSSGGPLVDTGGAVIGIVVALVNPTGDRTFIGIGFAVPIGTAVGGAGGPQK
ncbi:MAG: trypsin-like peptidase domain-containing protein [Propionicimonas sp.]